VQTAIMENVNSLTQALPVERAVPASTPSSAATFTASMSTRNRIERSCLPCHQRKIRCNKRLPCSNCVRIDVSCSYPGTEPSGRRPPRTSIAEVATRVARLERTITAMSNGILQTSHETASAHTPSFARLTMSRTQTAEDATAELLVQGGYTSRYVNEVLLSRVLDKVGSTT
jgi:hypothetical protein